MGLFLVLFLGYIVPCVLAWFVTRAYLIRVKGSADIMEVLIVVLPLLNIIWVLINLEEIIRLEKLSNSFFYIKR
jgi:cation transporter-like permease